MFWDDDGKVYYCGTVGFGKDPYIWIAEIDLISFCIISDKKLVWAGALKNCHSPEGPHLYKKNGWYYLLIAEGGTEIYHAVTIARSRNLYGPYIGNPANPILTHRHLGQHYPICNVGHADMVELKNGSWYMVVLGSRIYGGYHKNMGRETFLVPVIWENEWPVVSPGSGKVEWTYPAPDLPISEKQQLVLRDDFVNDNLNYCWNTIGTPDHDVIKVKDSHLLIKTIARSICPSDGSNIDWMQSENKIGGSAFLGRRQQHMCFDVRIKMFLHFQQGCESAGMIILQNSYQSIRVEMKKVQGNRKLEVILGYIKKNFSFGLKTVAGNANGVAANWNFQHNTGSGIYHQELIASVPWKNDDVIFKLHADMQDYSLYAIDKRNRVTILKEHINAGFLGSETAGGCIGEYIGMFASGNGKDVNNYAEFDWFEYLPENDNCHDP